MLIAEKEGARVEATDAVKGPRFHCPGCSAEVILKQGQIRIPHFAHKAVDTACSFATGETLAHLSAKAAFKAAWTARGVRAELEYPLAGLTGDRRADVLVWSPDGSRYAIELQHSSITPEAIQARTESYHRMGVGVIWVAFFQNLKFEEIIRHGDSSRTGYKFAAPAWQRWVHGFNFGHIWFYDHKSQDIWCGKFKPHEIEVPESSWYENGEEVSAGGYTYISRRWKTVKLRGPFQLADIRIEPFIRKPVKLGNYFYPGGRAARLLPVSCRSIKELVA